MEFGPIAGPEPGRKGLHPGGLWSIEISSEIRLGPRVLTLDLASFPRSPHDECMTFGRFNGKVPSKHLP
jgi:hypothetical protein